MRKRLLIFIVLICVVLLSSSMFPTFNSNTMLHSTDSDMVTISRDEYEKLLYYQELAEIRDIVNTYYYEDVDQTDMMEGAAFGLLAGIGDPYTFYYTPEDYKRMWDDDEGEYAGVGMMISASYLTHICTITRVFDNSPALKSGICRGDILIKVDDLDVVAENLQDAVDIMRGEIGKPVHIQVLRGDEVLDFDVIRAVVNVNYVSSTMLEKDIGYICLYEFSGKCSNDFIKQVRALVEKGAKALIIDLRDNPGGWVSDAETIADLFLGEGVLFTVQYKDGSQEVNYTHNAASDLDIPLVIMVNENTASSSEILAGALQDRSRATVVGTKSYGKGIIQWVLDVGTRGAGMQLTIAQYFTPNGNKVHKVGITPDVIVERPDDEESIMFEIGDMADTQLRTAYDTALNLVK